MDERLIVNIDGRTKRGKTSVALSFPRPMFFFDFDHQVRELLRKNPDLAEGLQFPDPEYHIPERIKHEKAVALIDRFLDEYQDACEVAGKLGGTIVVDTHTQLHQFIQKIKLDDVVWKRRKEEAARASKAERRIVSVDEIDADLTRIFPYDYREANALETAILQRPYIYPKLNAVFINRHQQMYSDRGEPLPEKFEFQGFKNTADLVQLNVTMKLKQGDRGPIVAVFGPNRWQPALVGQEWVDPLTYETLTELFLSK